MRTGLEPVTHTQLKKVNAWVGVLNARVGEMLKADHHIPILLFTHRNAGANMIAKLKMGTHIFIIKNTRLTEVMHAHRQLYERRDAADFRLASKPYGGNLKVRGDLIAARGGMGVPSSDTGIPIPAQ